MVAGPGRTVAVAALHCPFAERLLRKEQTAATLAAGTTVAGESRAGWVEDFVRICRPVWRGAACLNSLLAFLRHVLVDLTQVEDPNLSAQVRL